MDAQKVLETIAQNPTELSAVLNTEFRMQRMEGKIDRLIGLLETEKSEELNNMSRLSCEDLQKIFGVGRKMIKSLEDRGVFLRSGVLSTPGRSFFVWGQIKKAILKDIVATKKLYQPI